MPNHVRTLLTVEGSDSDIAALISAVRAEESAFSLNAVIPMPKELQGVNTGGTTIDGEQVRRWLEVERDGETVSVKIPPETLARWQSDYGASDWYDWAVNHWGTKWDVYNAEPWEIDPRGGAAAIEFSSAWREPKPVFEALAERFPALAFYIECSGEVDADYSYTLNQPSRRRQRTAP